MARTRQKAKQRKAKRLEQERKAAERAQGGVQSTDAGASGSAEALAEIEEAQVRAARELDEAQEVEVGAGAEAARTAAAAEAATAAEVATTGRSPQAAPSQESLQAEPSQESLPVKPSRRERRRAREEVAQKEKAKAPRAERKREPKPAPKPERKREARPRGRVVNFLKQVWAELRRVQWPDRTQVTHASAVVIVFCFIAGGYLAIWDFFFSKLIKAIL
jgi:preprotein translocase subunit SecE